MSFDEVADYAPAVMFTNKPKRPAEFTGAELKNTIVAEVMRRINLSECTRRSERFPDRRRSDIAVTSNDGKRHAFGNVNACGRP